EYPLISKLISILDNDHLKKARAIGTDFIKNDFVVTFNGLVTETQFVKKVITILNELEKTYGSPVDIEFAHDGEDFYLLQCRSQSYSEDSQPGFIPANLPGEKIKYSAHRYITNGKISDISHVVFVDPQSYSELTNQRDMLAVGEAIGKLNKILPRRQFILIGPGRWGSRGDIKLGVNVSYSEINNTAMLIEVARKQKDYIPDLSFGTHFFQDLVEARIRYLPLYPDDEGNIFNEEFLMKSKNILPKILPEFKFLSGVIKVIDVPKSSKEAKLEILMNASIDEAVAILSDYNKTK
ncbi:MAG: PEP/pyruvate-binding domain-containing protein, partial [Ignavibacteriaceae bacterium]